MLNDLYHKIFPGKNESENNQGQSSNNSIEFISSGQFNFPSFRYNLAKNDTIEWSVVGNAPELLKSRLVQLYNDALSQAQALNSEKGNVTPGMSLREFVAQNNVPDSTTAQIRLTVWNHPTKIGVFLSPEIPFSRTVKQNKTLKITSEPRRWRILCNLDRRIVNGLRRKYPGITIKVERCGTSPQTTVPDEITLNFDPETVSSLSRKWKIPALGECLKKLIERFDSRDRTLDKTDTTKRSRVLYLNNLCLDFDQADMECLKTLSLDHEKLIIPAYLCCEKEREEIQIEIIAQNQATENRIAIDYGSSASTACFSSSFLCESGQLGLPKEQLDYLQDNLLRWFTSEPQESNTNMPPESWYTFVLKLAGKLQLNREKGEEAHDDLCEYLRSCKGNQNKNESFYNFLLMLELTIAGLKDEERRYCNSKMYKFYRETFRRFPFLNRGFHIPEFKDHTFIESEFRLDRDHFWPEGEMGISVANERRERERAGHDISNYFRNPKEYINRISENHLRSREIYLPKSIYQGAIDTLVTKSRTIMDRVTANRTNGLVCDLVVTYPVTLLPKCRGKLRELTEQLGYPALSVILNYDESVAPAIFYLDKYFGNFDEIGPEAFKMKCQFDQGIWSHNMLIVDIGAGTTDISLIQIEMTEKFPQTKNNLGGRSYEIMPTLLGSLGYGEMGGNLLTLKIFKQLKYILANFIEEANKENPENKPCKHGNFGFGGTLSTEDKQKLKFAETKLPTQTRTRDTRDGNMVLDPDDRANRVRLFDYLWSWAEEIKIHYSLRLADEKCEADYNLNLYEGSQGKYFVRSLKEQLNNPETGEFLRSILKVNNLEQMAEQLDELLLFTQKAFLTYEEDIVKKVVKSSVDLTQEALKVRQEKLQLKRPDRESFPSCSGVNSIVLSGRTSRLVLIKELFQKKIDESNNSQDTRPFAVPQAEIIFEDEYAKTATVTGAMRAHQIDRDSYVDVNGNPRLLQGGCYRILRVKNLLFNLPCEFYDGSVKIFTLQSEFTYMDFTDQMRLRSNNGFHAPRQGTVISQQIGERSINPQFAILRTNDISQATEGRIDQNSLRVQYEITPELIISALVARIPQGDNAKKELCLWRTRNVPGLKSPLQATISPKIFSKLFSSNDKRLSTDITYTTSDNWGDAPILFAKDTQLTEPVLDDRATSYKSQNSAANAGFLLGTWSKNPITLFKNQKQEITFLAKKEGTDDKPGVIAVMNLGAIIGQTESYKDYVYRILLTQDGVLTLFVGEEPPYCETEDLGEWEKNEHMVYRQNITLEAALFDSDNNPFNGRQ